jgi:hypothetical protein
MMPWVTRRPHTIVALADSLPLFHTAPCRDLAAAYLALQAAEDGRLPAKSRLDVTALARAVPHLLLCAITRPDRCIYRVIGEDVKARIGNRAGRNFYDLVPAERRANAMHVMNMLIDVPCAWRIEIEQSFSRGIRRPVEALALPLASTQAGVDGFAVLANCEIGHGERASLFGVTLLGTNVLRRDLIDLGFGVDETFEDLVPAPD